MLTTGLWAKKGLLFFGAKAHFWHGEHLETISLHVPPKYLVKFQLVALGLLLSIWSSTVPICAAEMNRKKIRVALFLDRGAHVRSQLRDALKSQPDIDTDIVDGQDVRDGYLSNFDVLVVPGGSGKMEADSLTSYGREEIRRFVRNGGSYMGICAGCYLASKAKPQYLGILPMVTVDSHWRRGKALLPIEFTQLGMDVFGPRSPRCEVVYHNGPVLAALNQEAKREIYPLSFFRGEVVAPGGTRNLMIGAPAMVLSKYGSGNVLGISPHPEVTEGLEQIEVHAIRWLFAHRAVDAAESNPTSATKEVAFVHNSLSDRLYNKGEDVFNRATVVQYRHLHDSAAEQVLESNNHYESRTDCSGFVSYVVNSIAPRHYATVCNLTHRSHPHAALYARFFKQLSAEVPEDGWLRIKNFSDLRRGDIIAWEKPVKESETIQSRDHTGHVMIVVDPPSQVFQENLGGNQIKFVEAYVLDSSGVKHFPPEAFPPLAHQTERDGLGKGMVRLIVDGSDQVIGYWEGTYSQTKHKPIVRPTYTKVIGFGRLVSLKRSQDSHPD